MVTYIKNRIVDNPNIYRGFHQEAAQRTSDAFKPLEPKSQVIFINIAFSNLEIILWIFKGEFDEL